MKIELPRIEDEDCANPVALGERLRAVFRDISLSFQKIRIDGAIIIGGGTKIDKHLSITTTWDPANVAAGAQISTTVALVGAALGDEATCSFSLDLQLQQLTAYVSAAGVVTVILRNGTAGGINLGSGTLRVSVWKH